MELEFPLRAAFIAIPLEGKPKWLFQAAQEALREYEEVLSFQNPQTPHLTLQYWPQLMEIEYGRICQQAVKLSSHVASFSLKVLGAKAFGSRGEDHVLYLDIPFSDELARLKKACPWPSAQPFSPHITLARIRHPQRFHIHKKHVMKALSDVSFELPVSMLRLYGEVHGRKQTPLQDFSFFGTSQTSSSSSSPF